jgi:tripartite-type tricarboxylate transporter receptor subunit TctC
MQRGVLAAAIENKVGRSDGGKSMPRRLMLLAALLVSLPGYALAQTLQKPIQIIVPFPPGASADGIARIVAAGLGPLLTRNVVVENRPGAGGALGLITVAKAAADGDTLGIAAPGAMVINPHIPGAMSFDPLRELTPIAELIELPIVLVSNPKTGPKSIAEMIARAKASPAGLSYGSTGVNTGQHLAMELLKKATGANLIHVPYRGSTPAVADVMGGQIPVAIVDLTSAYAQIEAGNLLALGVAQAKRSAIVPDIPTFAESGVPDSGLAPGFIGLVGPADMPAAVVKRYSHEIGVILAEPEVKAKVRVLAAEVAYKDDDGYRRMLADESAKWEKVIATLGVTN